MKNYIKEHKSGGLIPPDLFYILHLQDIEKRGVSHLNKNFRFIKLMFLSVLFTTSAVLAADDNETILRRSGFKEISEREEIEEDNSLVNITLNFKNGKSTGNYTNGNVTDAGEKIKKTTEDDRASSKYNVDLSKYKTSIENVEPNKLTANTMYKATQADLDALLAYAVSKEGNCYYYGGNNPDVPNPDLKHDTNKDGVDCSGYVCCCYKAIGLDFSGLWRTSTAQYESLGVEVGQDDIQPGDVICFCEGSTGKGKMQHVGISLGGTKFINASGENQHGAVKIAELQGSPGSYYIWGGQQSVKGVKRVLNIS